MLYPHQLDHIPLNISQKQSLRDTLANTQNMYQMETYVLKSVWIIDRHVEHNATSHPKA